MHQINWVKLQFDYQQEILDPPRCLKEHHEMNIMKSWKHYCIVFNKDEQGEWRSWQKFVLRGTIKDEEFKLNQEYMSWFKLNFLMTTVNVVLIPLNNISCPSLNKRHTHTHISISIPTNNPYPNKYIQQHQTQP